MMKRKRVEWIVILIMATAAANADGLLESELIFEPTKRFPSSHCSDIEVLPSGDLFVVWYAGSVEKATDVAVVCARRHIGSQEWEPGIVIDTPEKSDGNPVLAQPETGLLELYYQVMHGSPKGVTRVGTGWTTCDIRRIVSRDEGRTWSEPEMIRPEWGYITKGALIRLQDDTWLLPLSDERNFYSLAALST
ncbi:MAG: exo-alpha-sialidase, partial [bacterium]